MKLFYVILLLFVVHFSKAQFFTTINGKDTACISQESIYSVKISEFDNQYLFRDTVQKNQVGNGFFALNTGYSYDVLKNTFSYDLWVKPTRTIIMSGESNACAGDVSVPLANSNQNWAIVPVGLGGGEMSVGLTIGTNGLMVGEHSGNILVSRLSYTVPINDWVHVAIVYRTDSIFLYLNGNMVRKRLTHCSSNIKRVTSGLTGYYYSPDFKGNIDEFRLWDIPLTSAQIQEIKNKKLVSKVDGLRYYASFDNGKFERTLGDIGNSDMTVNVLTKERNIKKNDWILNSYTGSTLNNLTAFLPESLNYLWSTGSTNQTTLFVPSAKNNELTVLVYNSSVSKNDSIEITGIDCNQPNNDTIHNANGLVAYYPFNGNANDESGFDNNGTVFGATLSTDRYGNPNSAYNFRGSDWIEIPHSQNINFELSNSYSISVWVKISANHNTGSILDKWINSFDSYPYTIRCTGQLSGSSSVIAARYIGGLPQDSTHNQIAGFSDQNQIDTSWNNIVSVFQADGTIKLYFNGILVDNSLNYMTEGSLSNFSNLFVGRRGGREDRFFIGSIDDISIYNRALSLSEIKSFQTVCDTVKVTTTPASANVCAGDSVLMQCSTLAASTFQWYKDGTIMVDSIKRTCYAKEAGNYTVKTNLCSIPSTPVSVTIMPLPLLSILPSSTAVTNGQQVALNVSVGPKVGWVWLAPNPSSIYLTSANPVTLNLTKTTTFQVVGGDQITGCAKIDTVTIVVYPFLTSGTIQSNAQVCLGETPPLITSNPATGGNGIYTYQWQMSTISDSVGFSDIQGANLLTYQPGPAIQTTWYRLMISSLPYGSVNSDAVVVAVSPNPTITSVPARRICSGENVNYQPASNIVGATFTWSASVTSGTVSGFTASGNGNINDILSLPMGSASSGQVTYVITPIGPAPSNCPGTPINLVVTINPVPLVTNPVLSQSVCAGTFAAPVVLQSNLSSTTFTWTVTATAGITGFYNAGSGNIPARKILSSSSVGGTIRYAITPHGPALANCDGPTVIYTINVNPSPSLTTSPLQQTICSGGSTVGLTLTSNVPATTFTWTASSTPGTSGFTGGNGSVISQTLLNSTNTPGLVTYHIIPSGSLNGCIGAASDYIVTVNPKPAVTAIPTSTICSGQSTNISPTSSVAGTTFIWTASGPGSLTGFSDGTGNTIAQMVTNSSDVPADLTYVITPVANGCSGPPINTAVKVNPEPIVDATTLVTICSGQTTDISLTPTVAGSTYTWHASGSGNLSGFTNGTANPIAQTITNSSNVPEDVIYTITPTADGCEGSPVSVAVTVNPLPILTSTPTPAAICSNTVFNSTPTSSIPGTVFAWSRAMVAGISNPSASGSGNPGEMLINVSTVPVVVTYVYTITANGCSNSRNVSVAVNPSPALTSTLSPSAICSNSVFSYVPTSADSGATFNWSRAAVAGITNGASAGTNNPNETLINITASPINVTYIYTLSANGCINPVTFNVVVVVNPKPTLSSSLTPPAMCSNTVFSYLPASGTASTTFSWTRAAVAGISNPAASGTDNPNETLINTTSNSINVVYVYTLSANGCTNVQNVTVSVKPTPILSSSLSPTAICSNTAFSYLPASATAGTVFGWSRVVVAGISNPINSGVGNPNETLINTSANPVNVTYVYALNAAGCSNNQNVVVTVNPTPVLTSSLAPPSICSNTAFSYTPTSGTVGTTFSWTRAFVAGISNLANAGTGNPNETLINTGTANRNVTYIYTLSANGCTNPATFLVRVVVKPTLLLSSSHTPPAICSNATFSYTPTSATAGTTFNWTRGLIAGISNAANDGTNNPNEVLINTTASPINVTYVYTLTAAGCPNIQNVVVVVNPSPTLTSTLTPLPVCSNTAFSYNPTSGTAGVVFEWSRSVVGGISNSAASGIDNPNESLVNTTTAPVVVTYVYTLTANGCSNTQNVAVTVNPKPTLTSTLSAPDICSNSVFSYTPASATGGTAYTWTRATVAGISNVAASGINNPNESLVNLTANPINVTYAFLLTENGCSNTQNVVVGVYPSPRVTNSSMSQVICSGATSASVNLLSNVAGTNFTWIATPSSAAITGFQVSGGGAISPQTIFNSSDVPGKVTYQIIPILNFGPNCTGTIFTYTITVNPLPQITSSLNAAVCSGQVFDYRISSNMPEAKFNWARAAVSGISNPSSSGSSDTINEVLVNSTNSDVDVQYILTPASQGPAFCTGKPESLIVKVRPLPHVSAESDITIPYGAYTTLQGNVSGGTGSLSCSWSPDSLISAKALTLSPQTIKLYDTCSFTLSVNDSVGCTSNDQMTVFAIGKPLTVAPIASFSPICVGEKSVLYANATGGSGMYSYSWTSVPDGFTSNFDSLIVSPTVTTTYSVTVNDGYNLIIGSITVMVNPLPLKYQLTGGGSYYLGGTGVEVGLSGSQSGVLYKLYNNGNLISDTVRGNEAPLNFGNQTVAGSYSVSATHISTGCSQDMGSIVDVSINHFTNTEGLVAHYPFNGNANDESGKGNHGTPSGASLTTDRHGITNSAYQFNGTDNYIRLLNPLPIDNVFTISFWAYNEMTGGSYGNVISDGGSQHGGNDFLLNLAGDRIGIRADKGGNSLNYEYNSPSEMSNLNISNKWIHVVWVMNPNQSIMYLDGLSIAEINESGTNTGYHDLNSFIGARQVWSTPDNFFKGKIDDIDIYNRALTATEVYALYRDSVFYSVELVSNPSTGGALTGGGNYSLNTPITIIATPIPGFSFINWTENDSVISTDASYSFTVSSNRKLVANFQQQQQFTITTSSNPSAGGTTSGSGMYSIGSPVTVTAIPDSGCTFIMWAVNQNVVSITPSYSFTATANLNLVAYFALPKLTLTTSSNPPTGGSTFGSGLYEYGSQATVNVSPNPGYTFVNWTENGNVVPYSSEYTFTMKTDRNLVANFISTVGIAEHFSKGIRVYPNPVKDKLTISFEKALCPISGDIKIFNSLGELAYKDELEDVQGNIVLDLQDLKPGIYNLLISDKVAKRVAVFKIIVLP